MLSSLSYVKPRKCARVNNNPNNKFIQVIKVENTRREAEAQLLGTQAQFIINLHEDGDFEDEATL